MQLAFSESHPASHGVLSNCCSCYITGQLNTQRKAEFSTYMSCPVPHPQRILPSLECQSSRLAIVSPWLTGKRVTPSSSLLAMHGRSITRIHTWYPWRCVLFTWASRSPDDVLELLRNKTVYSEVVGVPSKNTTDKNAEAKSLDIYFMMVILVVIPMQAVLSKFNDTQ